MPFYACCVQLRVAGGGADEPGLGAVPRPEPVRQPPAWQKVAPDLDADHSRKRLELAVFEEIEPHHVSHAQELAGTPFAEQEAELRRMLGTLLVARHSIDRSGLGMRLSENLSRDFPRVDGENFTKKAKERWAKDFKILLQRRDVTLPRDRDLVGQVHTIKRRMLPLGKASFDPSATPAGQADRFWAVALACDRERQADKARLGEIGVRVIRSTVVTRLCRRVRRTHSRGGWGRNGRRGSCRAGG